MIAYGGILSSEGMKKELHLGNVLNVSPYWIYNEQREYEIVLILTKDLILFSSLCFIEL
jgi:hypothetical protein